uniref:Uncharacterized protein n=1 Tax=Clastoptera arizonana TaxID=38151 RepID=A0A1B6CSA1_9HEMI
MPENNSKENIDQEKSSECFPKPIRRSSRLANKSKIQVTNIKSKILKYKPKRKLRTPLNEKYVSLLNKRRNKNISISQFSPYTCRTLKKRLKALNLSNEDRFNYCVCLGPTSSICRKCLPYNSDSEQSSDELSVCSHSSSSSEPTSDCF